MEILRVARQIDDTWHIRIITRYFLDSILTNPYQLYINFTMNIREHFNNVLHLLKEPFSVIELAEAECLPPVLHTSNIALLMHTDSKKIQEAFEIVLKGLINNDILPAITVEEYINLTIEHERQREVTNYMNPLPPSHLPPITAIALGHQNTDLLPGNAELNPKKWRMYLIRRDDFKKWLETEGEWPLPRENLLSRWWPNIYSNNKVDTSEDYGTVSEQNIVKKARPDVIPFSVPPGTEWKQVFISFVNEQTVKIKAARNTEHRSFDEMGFSDLRAGNTTSRPSDLWGVFRQLAILNGEITIDDSIGSFQDPLKVKKWLSQIRKKLQEVFPDIPGDPFHPYKDAKGYKTRFAISTSPSFHESR